MSPTKAFTIIIVFLLYSINSFTHSHGFKITTRLIHRDSIYSPLYNASETTEDRAKRVLQSSLARHDYLSSSSGIETELVLVKGSNVFHVNISIGEPPVPQLVIMDTGSDMLWVKCLPCSPCSSTVGVTIFDPSKSTTYSTRQCVFGCHKCSGKYLTGDCMYEIRYVGSLRSEGVYASDQITFRTSDDGFLTVPNMLFGCSSLLASGSAGNVRSVANGVLGLGGVGRSGNPYGESSLISRLGSKFSYCVGSAYDRTYLYNHLSIGEDSDLLGYSTPFRTDWTGHYYAHVKKVALSILVEVPLRGSFEVCFRGTMNREGMKFPIMGLHFADGAMIVVDHKGLFIQVYNDVFCLAVLRSPLYTIIGVLAQQGYNVGYDLEVYNIINLAMSPFIPLSFFLFIISTSHGLNITIPLIHRDSIYSPLYNATETIEDRAQRVAKASLDRHEHLSSALSIRPEAKLVPGTNYFVFYVNVSLGDPPLPQLVLMDTSSSLLWVVCMPCSYEVCKHGPADPKIYDMTKSKTSYALPCQDGCHKCNRVLISRTPVCEYEIQYADGHIADGIYATEQLTFQTSNNDRSIVTVPNILFGCNIYDTFGNLDLHKHFSGIIGLGPYSDPAVEFRYHSLVSDLGSKFSYCIGPISDRSHPNNQISFGGKTNLIGHSTPFNIDTGSYFVRLVNISLGSKMVNIHPNEFEIMSLNRGILIDSGAELSYLPPGAFDVVKTEVRKQAAVRNWIVSTRIKPFEVCYEGSMDKQASGFPLLGYHFKEGAELLVNRIGLFIQVSDEVFCLAIQETDYSSISLIGMLAQQGHNIGFDVKGGRMYFQNIDCDHLPGTGK
ncbi:Probable aspartic protease At2g35615 [Linum perenne]